MNKRDATFSRKDFSRTKIIVLGVLISFMWAGLWTRAYFIQVVQGEDLAQKAQKQYWCQETLLGRRGAIYGRDGTLLARSITVNSVYANPLQVDNVSDCSRFLADTLHMEKEAVLRRLKRKKRFVWIKRKIGAKTAEKIKNGDYSGIHLLDEYERVYPQGRLLGQVLGFVGIDGKGLEGLEKSMDERLRGTKRRIVLQRDGAGGTIADPRDVGHNVDGQDVVLTIDGRLQFAAEEALAHAVRKYSGKSGTLLVIKVDSGEIMAWAHYPFFNPNRFQECSPADWRNRSALDLAEPGSTLKPFLIAAALEESVCKRDSLYFCENGEWELADTEIEDTHEYEWLPVNKVLRYSSNIGAAKIGMDLGPHRFFNYLVGTGLNDPLQLPLPGQADPILRPPGKWNTVDMASASFGQGLAVTPLHLGRAYLCLANNGVRKGLQVLKKPESSSGKDKRVFSPEVATKVRSMLKNVVQEDGTGKRARMERVTVGGKTGTAQKASTKGGYSEDYVASFIGFLPAMQPKYVVMCMVDEPEKNIYGGVVSAPAVKKVGKKILAVDNSLPISSPKKEFQTARRENSVRRNVSSRRKVVVKDGKMPDLRGMDLRNAVEALSESGSIPKLKGKGVVISKQEPKPGEEFSSKNRVVLWLKEAGSNG